MSDIEKYLTKKATGMDSDEAIERIIKMGYSADVYWTWREKYVTSFKARGTESTKKTPVYKKRMSKETVNKIMNLLEGGMAPLAIANMLSMNPNTVRSRIAQERKKRNAKNL